MAMYKRIIVKLSGETLAPKTHDAAFDADRVAQTAKTIAALSQTGVQLGIVLGGGNIWRGRFSDAMNPVNADQMGMLATIINALCLQDALVREGVDAKVFTAQEMNRFATLYTAAAADAHLQSGGVALLAGGTGNPFFTTDTGAALRAAELGADAVFKGTNVEGVFDKDPNKYADAVLIPHISLAEAAERRLKAMDITAYQMCLEAKIPVVRVFAMEDLNNVIKVAQGDSMGTTLMN